MNVQDVAKACLHLHMFRYHYALVLPDTTVYTFAIHRRDVSLTEALDIEELPFYVRTFDTATGRSVVSHEFNLDPHVLALLNAHYTDAECETEGQVSLDDYNNDGSGELETHPAYGQATHYSDFEELNFSDGLTVCPGHDHYFANGEWCKV